VYDLKSSKVYGERMENTNRALVRATINAGKRVNNLNKTRNRRNRASQLTLAKRWNRRSHTYNNKNTANARATRNAAMRFARMMSAMRGQNIRTVPRNAAREARWRGHNANLNKNAPW
jgi:hypothetical protein